MSSNPTPLQNKTYAFYNQEKNPTKIYVKQTNPINPFLYVPYLKSKGITLTQNDQPVIYMFQGSDLSLFWQYIILFGISGLLCLIIMISLQKSLEKNADLSDEEFKYELGQTRKTIKALITLCQVFFGFSVLILGILYYDYQQITYAGSSTESNFKSLFFYFMLIVYFFLLTISTTVVTSILEHQKLTAFNILILVTFVPIFSILLYFKREYILPQNAKYMLWYISIVFLIASGTILMFEK